MVYPGTYYGPLDFERKNLVVSSLFILEQDESEIKSLLKLNDIQVTCEDKYNEWLLMVIQNA